MKRTVRLLTLVLGLAAAFSAGRWTYAQTPVPPPPSGRPEVQVPVVLAGDDIGFRVERQEGLVPVGRLVVRVNGMWVQPEFAMDIQRVTVR